MDLDGNPTNNPLRSMAFPNLVTVRKLAVVSNHAFWMAFLMRSLKSVMSLQKLRGISPKWLKEIALWSLVGHNFAEGTDRTMITSCASHCIIQNIRLRHEVLRINPLHIVHRFPRTPKDQKKGPLPPSIPSCLLSAGRHDREVSRFRLAVLPCKKKLQLQHLIERLRISVPHFVRIVTDLGGVCPHSVGIWSDFVKMLPYCVRISVDFVKISPDFVRISPYVVKISQHFVRKFPAFVRISPAFVKISPRSGRKFPAFVRISQILSNFSNILSGNFRLFSEFHRLLSEFFDIFSEFPHILSKFYPFSSEFPQILCQFPNQNFIIPRLHPGLLLSPDLSPSSAPPSQTSLPEDCDSPF